MTSLNVLINSTTTTHLNDLFTHSRDDLETTTTTNSFHLDEASRRKAPDIHDQIDEIVARINFGFMFFGIVGNFLCICVLMQKNLLNRKFNWYLLLLAVADLAFSIIVFTNYYIVLSNHTYALYDLSWVTCYFTDYVVNSLDAFCVFLTLLLSVDRLYAIMKPIQSKTFFTYRYPKRIAVYGYLALLAIKSPELFLSQRKYVYASSSISSSSSYHNDPSSTFTASSTLSSSTLSLIMTNYSSSTLSFMTSTPPSADTRDISIRDNYCQLDTIGLNEPSVQGNDSTGGGGAGNSSTTVAGNATPLIIYILYCNIFIPLLFNIVPALIILVLNLTLWCFIRHYTHISNTSNLNHARSLSSSTSTAVATPTTNPYQLQQPSSNNNHHKGSFLFSSTTPTSTAGGRGGRFSSGSTSMNGSMASASSYLASISKSRVTKAQKSYYFTIIMLGIWLLLTTIPYYSLYTYYWATSLRFINDRSRLHMTVQAISSAFFNSNHCINIVIYLLFHKDFRSNALHIMCQVFNINPLCKINPLYFGSITTRNRTERNVYKTQQRYQAAAEYSCASVVSPPQQQPHIVRICEPTANDIHLISDRPFQKAKSNQQTAGTATTPQELKSCINYSTTANNQFNNNQKQYKSSLDLPLPITLKRASDGLTTVTTTRTTTVQYQTAYELRQKRQQGKDYARPERLFIPNRALLKCLGGGDDVDDKRKSSSPVEEPLCDGGADEAAKNITQKVSIDGSSNLSMNGANKPNNAKTTKPKSSGSSSSASSSNKKGFWSKFFAFRLFSRKK